jgi:cytochrome c oxidase subunit 2
MRNYPPSVRPPAEVIGTLALIVGAIAILILIGVEGALVYVIWRYRASRQVSGSAATLEHNRGIEIAWTAAPALTLAVVFVLTLGAMAEIKGAGVAPAMRITAIGHQWWWEFSYGGVKTANELHIPTGTPIDLELTSLDVIHSFWVPELGPKADMLPARTNHLRLFARTAGSYDGQCAEFCGVEHAWMRIRVVVESPAEFETWLAAQSLPRRTRETAAERVFLSHICVNCHTIRGTAAAGTAGPDLTHVGGRATIGAGVLPNDVARMRAWLADPERYKPGSLMPRVPLSDADLDALAAYLGSLR